MKKILILASTILVLCACVLGCNRPIYAADDFNNGNNQSTNSQQGCDNGFLGFVPWYHNLPMDGNCNITSVGSQGAESIAGFVWKIVANILIDLFTAVGYVATGFMIYGGYLYIMSEGDPNRAARGKKTIISAVIGIVIAVLANLIIRTIMIIIGA